MAKEYYDKEIDKHTDWGGDESTGGIPVKGNRVQEFIKNTFGKKMGYFYYDEGNNRYIVFADEESKDEYLQDTGKTDLILGTFDAPFNYTAEINLTTPTYVAILAGATNNYIDFTFDVKNKQGASIGEDVLVTFTFTRGSVKQKVSQKYRYGTSVHFNVDKYISTGTNSITITVTGQTTLAATTVAVTYQVVDLQLSDELDISKVYNLTGGTTATLEVPFSVSGYGTKVMEWYLDGELIPYVKDEDEIVEVSSSRTKYIQLSGLSEGKHNIQFRAYTMANDEKFYSQTLYRDIIVITGDSNKTILATAAEIPSGEDIIQGGNLTIKGVTQYISYDIKLAAYNPTGAPSNVEIYVNDDKQGEVTVSNRTVESYSLVIKDYGSKTLKLKAGTTEYDIPIDVEQSDTDLTEITSGLFLDLQAVGKNNNSVNKDSWTYGDYKTTFSNFKWNENSGWNNNRLVITQGAYIDINAAPLAGKATETGLTLEFEFSTRDVLDNDEVICDLTNDAGTGLKITASEVILKSAGGAEVNTKFKSEENIRIALVINKKSGVTNKLLAFIYINGIISGAVNYAATDNFISNKTIRFASTDNAGIELKSLRFYNVALTSDQILNNYTLYRDTIEEMLEVYDKNNIYTKGTTDFSTDILAGQLPVMVITGDIPRLENTTDKNLEIVVDVEYTNLQDPTRSFSVKNGILRPQGTSSMSYPKKNYRLYTQRRDDTILYDADGKEVENKLYSFKEGAQPVNCWCMKADYAESSGTHNTGIARLWNDVMKNAIIDGEFKCRTNAQTKAAENKYPYDVRTTVDGFPILMFYRQTADDNLIFIGKYNFNNDKSTESVFGFKDIPGFDNSKMQCWEVLNNGNHLALFQDVTNFDKEWQDAFEARYPDVGDEADTTDLKSFATWLSSTKSNLEKFKSEKADHIDLYKMAAYYVYFMRFGAVDQTVKNAMFTSEDGQHWFYINYDNDTIMGVRNDGLLIYAPTIDRQTLDESFGAEVYAYAGHDSVLWNNLEADDEFMAIVRTVDDALYSAGLSYAKAIEMFDEKQSEMWPERVYNQDAQYKYVGPYVNDGVNNLFMLQGARRAHRRWWLSRRFNYIDSLFVSGEYKANIFEIKVAGAPIGIEFSIKSGYEIGYGYGVNNNPVETGIVLKPGESHTFTTKQVLNIGDPLRIYSAVNLQEIDVHNFIEYLSTVNMDKVYSESLGTRLKKLILGVDVSSDTKRNTSLTEISGLSAAKRLEYLDISGYKGLKTLDLTPFNNFKTLKAKQSGLTSVQFASGSLVEHVELPESIQSITLRSVPIDTSELIFENKYNLRYIEFYNCPNLSADFNFIFDWYSNKSTENSSCALIMTNIAWTNVNVSQLVTLGNLKKDGGTLDLKGKITLSSIDLDSVNKLIEIFGENCFEPTSELFITAPDAVFLSGPTEVYEGDSAKYTAAVFSENRGTVVFSVENGGDNISIDSETGKLTTTEIGQAKTITVKVTHTPTKGEPVSETLSVSVKQRVYPTMQISGADGIYKGLSEEFTLLLTPEEYNGVFTISWDVETINGINITAQDSSSCTISISNDVEITAEKFTLKAIMHKTNLSAEVEVSKEVSVLTVPKVIISKETNPALLKICYENGWCSSEEEMTNIEAANVKSFTGITSTELESFDEFEYFTGLISLSGPIKCSNLRSIRIPKNVRQVSLGNSQNLFDNCTNLSSVTFCGNSLTYINCRYLFNSCTTIENVSLPDSIEEIRCIGVFAYCYNLVSFNIPNKLTEFTTSKSYQYATFSAYCNNVSNIITENSSVLIKNNLVILNGKLIGCINKQLSISKIIDIPDEVTSIDANDIFRRDMYNQEYCLCKTIERVICPSSCKDFPSLSRFLLFFYIFYKSNVAVDTANNIFGNSEDTYTGRNTYNTGENKLYVSQGATGYDTGNWLDPLQNPDKCGFTLVEMVE